MGRSQPPSNWLPYFGMIVAFASVVYQSGIISRTVQNNSDRITKLEASSQVGSDQINSINVRTARIEAKLDFIVPKGDYERSVDEPRALSR